MNILIWMDRPRWPKLLHHKKSYKLLVTKWFHNFIAVLLFFFNMYLLEYLNQDGTIASAHIVDCNDLYWPHAYRITDLYAQEVISIGI